MKEETQDFRAEKNLGPPFSTHGSMARPLGSPPKSSTWSGQGDVQLEVWDGEYGSAGEAAWRTLESKGTD
jgi:hypothetical protein